MESFNLPVTVIITLAIGLSTLTVSLSDPSEWFESHSIITEPDLALTTQCDRLVLRYLMSENPSFEKLSSTTRKFVGRKPYDMLLQSSDKAFNYKSMITKDKIYLLRGKILTKLNRDDEAAENFRSALRWNPDMTEARKNLINHYINVRSFQLASVELNKAFKRASDDETVYFQKLLDKIEEAN